jgi:hypothetical protein
LIFVCLSLFLLISLSATHDFSTSSSVSAWSATANTVSGDIIFACVLSVDQQQHLKKSPKKVCKMGKAQSMEVVTPKTENR